MLMYKTMKMFVIINQVNKFSVKIFVCHSRVSEGHALVALLKILLTSSFVFTKIAQEAAYRDRSSHQHIQKCNSYMFLDKKNFKPKKGIICKD